MKILSFDISDSREGGVRSITPNTDGRVKFLITLCLLGNFACFLSAEFFLSSFRNTIRVSNSLDPEQAQQMSGLVWVQTVCKGYQQKTLEGKKLKVVFNALHTG